MFESEIPSPDVCWIVPPELLFVDPASPVTVRPPLLPVLLKTTPLVGPLAPVPALTLKNLRPLAPIVVLATFNAVAVVVVSVFVKPVTLTVPPPVALKAAFAPVESVSVPPKLIVEPVLFVSDTPAPEVTLSIPP